VFEKQEPSSEIFNKGDSQSRLQPRLESLAQGVRKQLEAAGFDDDHIEVEEYLNLRYDGTDTPLMTKRPKEGWIDKKIFEDNYKQE
jgi:5-oxoprolinase (ATP-hydrolysing)